MTVDVPVLCSRCLTELQARGAFEPRPGAGFCPTCRFWEFGPGVRLDALLAGVTV